MPRHYTEDEKQLVLQRLIANRGDVARTASDHDLDPSTLYRWIKQAELQQPDLLQLRNLQHFAFPPRPEGEGLGVRVSGDVPFNPEVLDSLYDLRDKMMRILDILADSIIPAIEEAPLNQRVAALTQITDRYIKLGHELPAEDIEIVMENDVEELPEEEEDDEEAGNPLTDTPREPEINS